MDRTGWLEFAKGGVGALGLCCVTMGREYEVIGWGKRDEMR